MKKITLNKETLRKLDEKELEFAKGGVGVKPCLITVTVVPTDLVCQTRRACGGPTKAGC